MNEDKLLRLLSYLAQKAGLAGEALLAPEAKALVGRATNNPKMSATVARMMTRAQALEQEFASLVEGVEAGTLPNPSDTAEGFANFMRLENNKRAAGKLVASQAGQQGVRYAPHLGINWPTSLEDPKRGDVARTILQLLAKTGKTVGPEEYSALRKYARDLEISSQNNIPKLPQSARDVERRLWFHGTKSPSGLDPITLENFDSRLSNLVGPGLYTTDDPSIALSYARQGKGGRVMALGVNPTNLLNLDEPGAVDVLRDAWKRALGTWFDERAFQESILKAGLSRRGLAASRYGLDYMAPVDAKDAWKDFIAALAEATSTGPGYTGFTHKGGILGGPHHNVAVFHQPEVAVESILPYLQARGAV